jgi:hypothetical protein
MIIGAVSFCRTRSSAERRVRPRHAVASYRPTTPSLGPDGLGLLWPLLPSQAERLVQGAGDYLTRVG